jgi:rhodanese-related sulfurtransferase
MTPTNNLLSGKDFLNKFSQIENAILIDVRTPDEFNDGHIDKAVNIDISNPEFKNEIKKLDKSLTYFLYCLSGSRSGMALRIMKNIGINNIYDLYGGIISNPDSIILIN